MPKSEEKPAGKITDIAIFKNKNNEPEIEIPPEKLQVILEYFNISGEFETIGLECENDHIQIVSTNPTHNIMPHYIGLPENTKIIKEGYFVLEPKKILDAISRKYKDVKLLNLSWKKGDKILITGDGHSPVKITPQAVTTLNIPPLNRRLPFENKSLLYTKKDGNQTIMEDDDVTPQREQAESFITVEQKELMKAAADLGFAGTSYIIFHFDEDGGWSETGSWSPKGDTSRTDGIVLDNFEGEPLEIAFPKSFLDVVKRLPGVIDIQGTKRRTAMVLSQWKNNEEIHYTIVETEKEE